MDQDRLLRAAARFGGPFCFGRIGQAKRGGHGHLVGYCVIGGGVDSLSLMIGVFFFVPLPRWARVCFVALFVSVLSAPSFAVTTALWDVSGANPPYPFATPDAAVGGFVNWLNTRGNGHTFAVNGSGSFLTYNVYRQTIRHSLNGQFVEDAIYEFVPHCASGSVWSNNGAAACGDPPQCPAAGTAVGGTVATSTLGSGGVVCMRIGCSVAAGNEAVSQLCADGVCYTFGGHYTGASCTPDAPASSAPPTGDSASDSDAACVSKGLCPGTVNGAKVCIACSTKSQTTKSSSSSSSTGTSSGGSSSSSGSTGTTTRTTECSGSSCTTTTTTTTTNSDGSSSTKTGTDTQPASEYCVQNPTAAVCKGANDSSWGGTCGSFSCDGDAVECAIAQASWKSACVMDVSSTDPLLIAGNSAMATKFSNGDPTDAGSVDVGSFDMSDRYTGSCPPDLVFTVWGKAIPLPISRACPYFTLMGNVAVVVSLLVAVRIAFGG